MWWIRTDGESRNLQMSSSSSRRSFYAIARTARVHRILSMFFQLTNASKDHQLESIYMWTLNTRWVINIIQTSRTKSSKCIRLHGCFEAACPIDSGTRVLAMYFCRGTQCQPYFDQKQNSNFCFYVNVIRGSPHAKNYFLPMELVKYRINSASLSALIELPESYQRYVYSQCRENTSNGGKRVEPINRKPNIIMIQ